MSLVLMPAYSATTAQQAVPERLSTSIVPLDLDVPFVPPLFRSGGRLGLAYELRLANFRNVDLRLIGVDVFPMEDRNQTLLSLAGVDLLRCLLRPGRPAEAERPDVLAGGQFGIVFLWVMLDPGEPVPSTIAHRVNVLLVRGDGSESEFSVEGAAIHPPARIPCPLAPPLRPGRWLLANGPSMLGEHRVFLHALDGRASNTQRFASDWMLLGPDGRLAEEDIDQNAAWHSYGEPVLAVAEAVVADVRDGIPENIPLSGEHAVPNKRESMTGNYVVLKLAEDRFAFYGHLQPGSPLVNVGDRVRTGQALGRIGNSGNSDAPHLHLHVSNSPDPLSGEGVPFALSAFTVLDVLDVPFWERMLLENVSWEATTGPEPEPHKNEMPLGEAIIEFR